MSYSRVYNLYTLGHIIPAAGNDDESFADPIPWDRRPTSPGSQIPVKLTDLKEQEEDLLCFITSADLMKIAFLQSRGSPEEEEVLVWSSFKSKTRLS